MLEQETEAILSNLRTRSIADRGAIHLKEVLSSDLPQGIKTYLNAEVVRWLIDDLARSRHFSYVDASESDTLRLRRNFARTLSAEYVFPREQFLTTLDHAVHFVENYVCRPQWTLDNFLLDRRDSLPVSELFFKLQYLADYSYFPKLIDRYVAQKQWREVSAGDLRMLISKIDEQIVQQHDPRELGLLAKPIFDFLLLDNTPSERAIPLKPVLVFFDDKGLRTQKEYLERVCHVRAKTSITLTELAEILVDLAFSAPEVAEAAKRDEPSAEPVASTLISEVLPSETPTAPIDSLTHSGITFIEEESPKKGEEKEQVLAEPGANPRPVTPNEDHATEVAEPGRKNVALSLTFAGMTAKTRKPSMSNLEMFISDEQRSRFIRKIFKKDDAYYSSVILALNRARTWKEASHYLNDFFEMNGLDPFLEVVIEFTDAVHRRYNPQTNTGR